MSELNVPEPTDYIIHTHIVKLYFEFQNTLLVYLVSNMPFNLQVFVFDSSKYILRYILLIFLCPIQAMF